MTRVWFLRKEDGYLRPVVDSQGIFFIAFHRKWSGIPRDQAARTFALFLLNPEAQGSTRYSFGDEAEIVRSILGDEETAKRLEAVSLVPQFHDAACEYLAEFLRKPCK